MKIATDNRTAGVRPGGAVVHGARSAGRSTTQSPGPAQAHAANDGPTRHAVVQLLLESGPVTAGDIGSKLGLSAAGVRRHLDALIELGDAEAHAAEPWRQAGRGRPAKRYHLTDAGRAKLGHRYDDLALAAMRRLREIGGKDAVLAFARSRIDSILAEVAPVDGVDNTDVEATAQRIAAALTKAGYVATAARVDVQGSPVPGVQILQHHCPVANVAKEFPELCVAERQAMADVLGTHVQRLATIANGGYVCTTHVPLTGKNQTNKNQTDKNRQ